MPAPCATLRARQCPQIKSGSRAQHVLNLKINKLERGVRVTPPSSLPQRHAAQLFT